jgi:DNA-binding NarL/FixJ family response regulator
MVDGNRSRLGPTGPLDFAAPTDSISLAPPVRLTTLEVQVLADVASGSSNKEIADRLGYSMYYVKDVVAGARRRLGARDRAHAAARAVALYLIEDDGNGGFRPTRLAGRAPRG